MASSLVKSSNPALRADTFSGAPHVYNGETMTVNGAVNATAVLLGLVILGAAWTWNIAFSGGDISGYMLGGVFGALAAVIISAFKKEWSPVLAPVYALLEGFALGGLSAMYEAHYHGLVMQAVGLTFGTLASLLMAYRTGLVRATENFKLGVFAATGGIFVFYMAAMLLSIFHIQVPYVFGNGPFGIAFSVVVVIVAALNLVLNFDLIENGARYNVPKYMEWYSALGLMVTLVWLYVEMLSLLSKLNSRR